MKTTSIQIGSQTIDDHSFQVWAGPCSIENQTQFDKIIKFVTQQGASGIRGGIYKLRTDKNSFQGLKEEAFPIIKNFKSQYKDTPFISEVTDPRQIETLNEMVDVFQVGTRNMFNYELLKELGKTNKPVLLKRFFSARIQEWIKAAEYIFQEGNSKVILCERGIRTFETAYRNTLDFNAVAFLKKETSFPVFVDPSHGTGFRSLVPALTKAALTLGADGILVEVHNEPEKALSDSQQSLNFEEFENLMAELKKIAPLANKRL